MIRIDRERLGAYVDGELDEAGIREVESALEADDSLRAELERERALRACIAADFDPALHEEVPERLAALLAPKDAEIVDLAAARRWRRRLFEWPNLAAIAASLAVGILLGQLALTPAGGPIETSDGVLVARGELAEMLDTRLASDQPATAAMRVGLTFRDREDRICRTFEAPALEGIACREGVDWQLAMTAATGSRAAEYRKAGTAQLLASVEAMMTGEPFDAIAELRARGRGWSAD